jgi:hypothetical protein
MSKKIKVTPRHFGTNEWRAVDEDTGDYLCDIRLSISSMLNGSRYYVLVNDSLKRDGTFNFGVWDHEAIQETVKAILHSMYEGAEITVELPRPTEKAVGS